MTLARPYAEVIGDPVAHSRSPMIHGFWLGRLGLEAEYRRCHVKPDELAAYFATRRADPLWRGCNITVPHKETARALVDDLLPGYPDIGAINLVVPQNGGLWGGNTDMTGVLVPLQAFHDRVFATGPIPPRNVGVIGAGGAARAALAALGSCGWLGELRLAVRNPAKGAALLAEFGLAGRVVEISDAAFAGLDVLINASTLGMNDPGDGALVLDRLAPGSALVFDMVYAPLETGLLRAARAQGHATVDGLEMLVAQAAGAFHHLFGQDRPRGTDAPLREMLLAEMAA